MKWLASITVGGFAVVFVASVVRPLLPYLVVGLVLAYIFKILLGGRLGGS